MRFRLQFDLHRFVWMLQCQTRRFFKLRHWKILFGQQPLWVVEVEPSPSLCEGVLNAPALKFLSMLATMIGPLAPPENLHSKSGGLGNGALRPPQPGGK